MTMYEDTLCDEVESVDYLDFLSEVRNIAFYEM